MKTMKNLTYALFALLLSITITSCDGDTGPVGPAGENGTNGSDGNANVIVKTIIPNPGPNLTWTTGSYLGMAASTYLITDSDITQNVSDTSLIMVYFQLFGQDVWYPMTYSFTSGTYSETITFKYAPNNITIYAFTDSGAMNPSISKLKYFLIEGVSSKKNIYSTMSYQEIMDNFDLDY